MHQSDTKGLMKLARKCSGCTRTLTPVILVLMVLFTSDWVAILLISVSLLRISLALVLAQVCCMAAAV